MTKNPLALVGAGWLVFVLVLAAGLPLTRGAPPPPFDQSLWLAHRNTPSPNPRRLMIDEIKALLPPGTPKAEVEALLGPSDWFGDRTLEYHVGGAYASIDAPYLAIHFDDQRRVVRFGMTEH